MPHYLLPKALGIFNAPWLFYMVSLCDKCSQKDSPENRLYAGA